MNRARLKDLTYMRMATEIAALATCPRASVGAVIVDAHGRVVATGYNGAPAGVDHCGCVLHKGHCVRAEHAEMNAILHHSGDLAGATLYVTHYPCVRCARAIRGAGITRVVYLMEYRPGARPIDFLADLVVERLDIHTPE